MLCRHERGFESCFGRVGEGRNGLVSQRAASPVAGPMLTRAWLTLAATVLAALSQPAQEALAQPVRGKSWMIPAENPLAVKAGADILAGGGSAVDAAVAIQLFPEARRAAAFGPWVGAFRLY